MKNFYSLLCKGKCTKCTKILTILLLLTVGLFTQVQTVRAAVKYTNKFVFLDVSEQTGWPGSGATLTVTLGSDQYLNGGNQKNI